MVEQRPFKALVPGSSPGQPTPLDRALFAEANQPTRRSFRPWAGLDFVWMANPSVETLGYCHEGHQNAGLVSVETFCGENC